MRFGSEIFGVKGKRNNFLILVTVVIGFAMILGACGGKEAAEAAPKEGEANKDVIRWRLQSYAGPALNDHVVKNAIDEFNIAANGEMV